VAPTGSSTLVTRGLLNLTHRDGHEHPTPLEPGKRYTVTVRLNAIAHSLPAGHRWRVAVSPTYWPWAWPSPEPVTLSVFTGVASRLTLPVRAPRPEDKDLAPFEPAAGAPPLPIEILSREPVHRVIRRDVPAGLYKMTINLPYCAGLSRLPASGLEYGGSGADTFTIVEGDPLSAGVRRDFRIEIGRGDWRTRLESTSTMTADATTFYVTNALDAYEGNTRVFAKTWTFTVARDLV
jgi:hypothetical protein